MSYGYEDEYFALWCLKYKHRFVNLANFYFCVWFVLHMRYAASENSGRTDTEAESEGEIDSKLIKTQMNL